MSGNSSWANPAPAGLVALAVACFTFYAILTGKVDGTAAPLLGCWIIGGFVVQLIVGLIELMEDAVTGGNIFLFFSAFFMLVGGLEFFVKVYSQKLTGIAVDTRDRRMGVDGPVVCTVAVDPIIFQSSPGDDHTGTGPGRCCTSGGIDRRHLAA